MRTNRNAVAYALRTLRRVDLYRYRTGRVPAYEYIVSLGGGMEWVAVQVLFALDSGGSDVVGEDLGWGSICEEVPGREELGLLVAQDVEAREPPVGLFFCGTRDRRFLVLQAYKWEGWSPRPEVVEPVAELAESVGCVKRWRSLPGSEVQL